MQKLALLNDLVNSRMRTYTHARPASRAGIMSYRAFYVRCDHLAGIGIEVAPADKRRPILLLGGTSIPICDRMGLITHLLASGYEVASIENPGGSFFDLRVTPGADRVSALRSFIGYLIKEREVATLDIVAQSYSAFETVRVLTANPALLAFVGSVVLINPPGLNENTTFVRHVTGFTARHLARGYAKALASVLRLSSAPPVDGTRRKERTYEKKEARGISVWTAKTLVNPMRTFREIQDIVTFRIKEPIMSLQNRQGHDINVFLQSGDQVVSPLVTEAALKDVLPPGHIKVVPGGHNDLFFQEWQRDEFVAFLAEVRCRRSFGEQSSRSA